MRDLYAFTGLEEVSISGYLRKGLESKEDPEHVTFRLRLGFIKEAMEDYLDERVHRDLQRSSGTGSKASLQAQKNERLAKKNPQRLQSQLDDLKKIESSGGKLTSHERSLIDGLEKEIKAVNKAREALGDAAPQFSHSRGGFGGDRGGRGGFGGRGDVGVLGKRRRDGGVDEESSESDVEEDVKRIPMPRDTPPPFPKEVLDKMEAVAFVPTMVRTKMQKGKGEGGLMEPEEMERLEKEGYIAGRGGQKGGIGEGSRINVEMEEVEDEDYA
ncbi:hypothetical protein DID88_005630 [Monilinia fructigena]|uniref:Wbp11/ELF5/Saf1 N-terminal domain-containing protein n=1 Tax=Monilinia fructigena TaxID=38457 RepID=A0A395J5M8_9HELO|nr:hypothetical protein DID88_005630 [Monilinia fructigena]